MFMVSYAIVRKLSQLFYAVDLFILNVNFLLMSALGLLFPELSVADLEHEVS